MAEVTRVLSASDPEWDAWLQLAPHDFYHIAAYHAFAESVGEGRPAMAVHGAKEQFLAWSYLVRDIDGTHADANSVYGYSGPTGRGLDDEAFLARAWSGLREMWAGQEIVTLFTRFHPLLGNERHCRGFQGADATPGGKILHLGRSVSIDLEDDCETRRSKYRQVLRQDIKRAEREGLMVEHDRDWRNYSTFIDLYLATMRRNDATESYLFSQVYFDNLTEALDGVAHLAVAQIEGEVAATMLFTVYNGIAEAHFTGTDRAHNKLSPLKGLIDGVADIARALGAKRLHIGAGRGGSEDSLYEFKSRFSPLRHDFRIGRWILDREANAELTERSPGGHSGFFPAYRAPASFDVGAT